MLFRSSQIKIVKGIATCYVDVLRGTPLLVQALLLYSGVPMILQAYHITFRWEEPIVAGIIACGINSSAYVGEIIRGGLKAVDKGQIEAAKSIGMNGFQRMRLIVAPQAFKIVVPSLGNEFVTLIKETAVLSAITIEEITRKSMLWSAATFKAWPAYVGTAICYMILTIPLSKIIERFEHRE